MDNVEQAAVDATEPAEATAVTAPSKPWLKPRLETWSLVGRTEGAHGAGADSAHCIS
jgi:hypothetical protein